MAANRNRSSFRWIFRLVSLSLPGIRNARCCAIGDDAFAAGPLISRPQNEIQAVDYCCNETTSSSFSSCSAIYGLWNGEKVDLNRLVPRYEELQARARSTIWLAVDGQTVALIAVADTVKEGSGEAVAALCRKGLTVAVLTGDSQTIARRG